MKKPQAVANLESAVVRLVRARGAIARIELARELKLVASTAGIYVDRLIERGYLVESVKAVRGLGRPPVMVELNPQGGRFIGVDFDARQVMAVAVDFAQQPLEQVRRTIPPRATTARVLAIIESLVAEVIGSRRRDVLGIGLAVPGPIDPEQGISREYKFIRDWHDVAIGPQIAARFQVPVHVENNLRSLALGELWCGQGRGLNHLVCLGIRSGIGSGIIADGKLLGGANNRAGEIGRWIYSPSAKSAARTIEDTVSLTAILAEAQQRLAGGEASTLGKPGDAPTVAELLAAAAAGDELALELVQQAARVHGWVAHQLAQLLDPQRVIVAGPL
ncbi:MAG TPA: ROK family protein, partial [Pirellulales bacterium]|nr:ROK family protein [Pirellulales bacterium]